MWLWKSLNFSDICFTHPRVSSTAMKIIPGKMATQIIMLHKLLQCFPGSPQCWQMGHGYFLVFFFLNFPFPVLCLLSTSNIHCVPLTAFCGFVDACQLHLSSRLPGLISWTVFGTNPKSNCHDSYFTDEETKATRQKGLALTVQPASPARDSRKRMGLAMPELPLCALGTPAPLAPQHCQPTHLGTIVSAFPPTSSS